MSAASRETSFITNYILVLSAIMNALGTHLYFRCLALFGDYEDIMNILYSLEERRFPQQKYQIKLILQIPKSILGKINKN